MITHFLNKTLLYEHSELSLPPRNGLSFPVIFQLEPVWARPITFLEFISTTEHWLELIERIIKSAGGAKSMIEEELRGAGQQIARLAYVAHGQGLNIAVDERR